MASPPWVSDYVLRRCSNSSTGLPGVCLQDGVIRQDLAFNLSQSSVAQRLRYKSSDGRFRYHDFCSELDAANRQRIEKTETKTAAWT